jgi:hypothetical protein
MQTTRQSQNTGKTLTVADSIVRRPKSKISGFWRSGSLAFPISTFSGIAFFTNRIAKSPGFNGGRLMIERKR